MAAADLPPVHALQVQAYLPALHESPAAFARRLAAFPDACWVVEDSRGTGSPLLGYLFAQPARLGHPPPLNAIFPNSGTGLAGKKGAAPAFHLHDLCVAPAARSRGIAQGLCQAAMVRAAALGYRYLTLVAVQGSVPYWQARGFRPAPSPAPLHHYGDEACYMVREVPDQLGSQSVGERKESRSR